MKSDKIKIFMQLGGQKLAVDPANADPKLRILGAQLLLSEVLEYVHRGLGVDLKIGNEKLDHQDQIEYSVNGRAIDKKEMLDGLADTAYTMYWNMLAFGMKLEEAFDLVCDNNLEKFVLLNNWTDGEKVIEQSGWHLNQEISWPPEVVSVQSVKVDGNYYAVGKDKNGKVRKPSSYVSVDLSSLV
jgi:predicted HAD superfamily Cof-like phosphohydrolase